MYTTTASHQPFITKAPELRRQDSTHGPLLGWYSISEGFKGLYCSTNEIFTSSSNSQYIFAGCHQTTIINQRLMTGCVEGNGASTSQANVQTCNFSDYSCVTQIIFQTSPGASGGASTNYLCGANYSAATTVYRDISTSSGSSSVGAFTTISDSAASTTSSAPTASSSSNSSSSSSKAWIAGPVIGAIVVIALLLGFAMWYLRRQRRRNNSGVNPAHSNAPNAPYGVAPNPAYGHVANSPYSNSTVPQYQGYGMVQREEAEPLYAHNGAMESLYQPNELPAMEAQQAGVQRNPAELPQSP